MKKCYFSRKKKFFKKIKFFVTLSFWEKTYKKIFVQKIYWEQKINIKKSRILWNFFNR